MTARQQDGFALPLVLGVLLVATLLGVAALAAARGGTTASGESRDDKQAYAAAEAGVNWYVSRLSFDNAFWAKCTTTAGPSAPVNAVWNGSGSDPRLWRTLSGSTAAYTVELFPANGKAACDTASPEGSMIDTRTGTMKIRSTGRFNGNKRSIIATLRRARFLDFLYLTTFETTDPLNYPTTALRDWAATNCNKVRGTRSSACSDIQFAAGDTIDGPLHSDDSLLICGAARFGRSASDTLETSTAAPGYVAPSGCGAPNFRAPFNTDVDTVPMPEGDDRLEDSALSAYTLTGTNYITLNGTANTIDIKQMTSATTSTTRTGVPWPANGLIYVKTGAGGCGSSSPPSAAVYDGSGADPYGCANVFVHGTYGRDITVGSANDVVLDGDLTRASGTDPVAGLIAKRFVRVFHPVTGAPDSNGNCTGSNKTGTLANPTIEAAILAVKHSFTVDNYRCGASPGTLTVTGGIAQPYRGAVGTGGSGSSTPTTGYLKAYSYDDRLTYRNPPYFLDPENAQWRVLRTSEQVPAR